MSVDLVVGVAPTVESRLGITSVTWPDPIGTEFVFDLLRLERRSGDLTAEVTVRLTSGAQVTLHRGKVNLSSSRTRKELAQHLAGRARGQGNDWVGLVEQACMDATDAFRAGEPAVLLREVERPMDAGWLLPPLVIGRHPTILFGDGGTAKSYLGLAAALSIHLGEDLVGIRPEARARVAYLDWEFDGWEHRERMRLLVGQDMPDIVYVRCQLALREEADRLRRIIAEQDIRFVVIDSVGMACDGPPEEAASALGFFEALRTLQVGALCIAHINRTGDTERPFGSTFWHNGARLTWFVKKVQDAGGKRLSVGLFNKKSNTGPLRPPLGFTLNFESDRTTITRTDVRDVPELAGDVPLGDRIERLVAAGAMTYAEISEALEAPVDSVKKAALRGVTAGRFDRIGGIDLKVRIGLADRRGDTSRDTGGHVPADSEDGGTRGEPPRRGGPLSLPDDPGLEVVG